MASGSFHDSSTHSGSYHSSGGFSSGGSGSGWGSGSEWSSGGGGGDSGGGIMLPYLLVEIALSSVGALEDMQSTPGFNFFNACIFIVAAAATVMALKGSEESLHIKGFSKSRIHLVSGRLSNAGTKASDIYMDGQPKDAVGDRYCWVRTQKREYNITLYDLKADDDTLNKISEVVKRTPGIVWLSPRFWMWITVVCSIVNLFLYELLIPAFERLYMTDQAFAFVDALIFYLPSVIALTSAIIANITRVQRHKYLYSCALRIVEERRAQANKVKTQYTIKKEISKKQYHSICPNCGAAAVKFDRACRHCGTSLEIISYIFKKAEDQKENAGS